ncbi:hypothetical protein [Tenacibaculum sp.]|uniref:hypothetical protein n=2 Tax=Tenacibaculum sp. TaxID=1906242 RepID=UPI003D141F7C
MHLRKMAELDKPTNKLLDIYIEKFNRDKRYKPADDAIVKLFKAFPKNDNIEDILLKISVINDMYSTNILGTFKMAEHILEQNIDKGLKNGDAEVVHQIAKGHGIRTKRNNTELNFYSFATKYCNWHNQESYAIYDSFVEKVLLAYKRKDKFSDFKTTDLKDFEMFRKIISDFLNYYGLTKHNLKQIDKFLWIYGKEKFPPNYRKK